MTYGKYCSVLGYPTGAWGGEKLVVRYVIVKKQFREFNKKLANWKLIIIRWDLRAVTGEMLV